MSRYTAPTAPRWLKTLQRNRARPRMPNEKSSSRVSSNRFFCASVSTLYTSCFVSAGCRSGRSRRCRCPCTRICGGEFVAMWRSDPSRSTIVFSSSGSVAITVSRLPAPAGAHLLDRFADDFFDRRQPVHDLPQAASTQRDHSLLDRFPPEFETRRADENQLAQFFCHFKDFVQPDAALVAGLVALLAAHALHRRHGLGFFGREARLHERRR